jgi:sodium-dependent phosphate cotransporter
VPLELASRLGKLTTKYRLTVFVYILMIFFFIPFSLIYLNKDSVEVVEATYERNVVAEHAISTYTIATKFQTWNKTGQMLVYNNPDDEPSLIFPMYRKNNILFLNNEMYMFNAPGFCWDGESNNRKYRMCIEQVIPSREFRAISFDSVYVYSQKFYNDPDSAYANIYISKFYPLILRREHHVRGTLTETEEITGFAKK